MAPKALYVAPQAPAQTWVTGNVPEREGTREDTSFGTVPKAVSPYGYTYSTRTVPNHSTIVENVGEASNQGAQLPGKGPGHCATHLPKVTQ